MSGFKSVKLSSQENEAIQLLKKYGWVILGDIDVYKAVSEGENHANYAEGGIYPIGILRRPGHVESQAIPPQKKRGRPKKSLDD